MVNIYDDIKNEIVERIACDLFQDFDITTERINPGNMIDVMVMLEDEVKVDIEKNENFVDIGEIAIDFVANCEPITAGTDISDDSDNLFDRFGKKQNVRVTEKGKHFQSDNFNYLMVFIYDHFINAKNYNRYEKPSAQPDLLPDHTLVIKSDELAKHIHENSDFYFDRVKIIKKTTNPLIDKVDHSVINVPIEKLRAETDCLFYEHIDVNQEEFLNYLNI